MKSRLKPIIRLRGHHLVCLHFFKGEGYNPEYIENLKQIVEKVESGAGIEIASGADDVCNKCPSLIERKCSYSADAEADIKHMDTTALRLFGFKDRDEVLWFDTKRKLPDVFPEWSRAFCRCCGWRQVCEKQEKFYRFANVQT